MKKVNVIVCGAGGRMGQSIVRLILQDFSHRILLAGAVENKADFITPQISKEQIAQDLEKLISQTGEVIIDFTAPESTLKNLSLATQHQKPLVIGTTGFDEEGKKQIAEASKKIPICFSPNMSVGVNVLFKLVAEAAQLLGDGYDVEVIEAHHNKKKDAPSGTAMKIADVLLQSLRRNPNDLCYDRHGLIGERPAREIGMQTVRGGDIVGDHTVMFAGIGERVEITHRATNRDNFARGAILAAEWLVGKKPGLYDMQDVLGLKK